MLLFSILNFTLYLKESPLNYLLLQSMFQVICKRLVSKRVMLLLGTNLIHDITAVTLSVKLAFFREKCPFLSNPWFFVNFNAFTFIYENFQSFTNSFCAHFAVCYVSHFITK